MAGLSSLGLVRSSEYGSRIGTHDVSDLTGSLTGWSGVELSILVRQGSRRWQTSAQVSRSNVPTRCLALPAEAMNESAAIPVTIALLEVTADYAPTAAV